MKKDFCLGNLLDNLLVSIHTKASSGKRPYLFRDQRVVLSCAQSSDNQKKNRFGSGNSI